MGNIQEDAGVLDSNGTLTEWAKIRFIDKVIECLRKGEDTPASLFPCLKPPQRSQETIPDLHNEELYPQFHEEVKGNYEEIAKFLNVQGAFPLASFGITDPVAMATAFGLTPPKLKFPDDFLMLVPTLPLVAFKLGFDLPSDLVAKIPELPSIPQIPSIPEFPPIPPNIRPDLPFPKIEDYGAFLETKLWKLRMPTVIINMIPNMPNMLTDILQLKFNTICKLIQDAELFGSPADEDANLTVKMATQRVLSDVTSECILFTAIGSTIGSSPAGVVGQTATQMGLTPPTIETQTGFEDWGPNFGDMVDNKGFTWPKRSTDLLADVDPRLVQIFNTALRISKYAIAINEGKRTPETQAKYFKAGASNTLNSTHLVGKAVDIHAFRSDGKLADSTKASDPKIYMYLADLLKQVAIHENINLQWGGSWQILNTDPDDALTAAKKEEKRAAEAKKTYLFDYGHYNLKDIA